MLALRDSGREVVVDDWSAVRRGGAPQYIPFYQYCIQDGALIQRIIADHGCRAVIHSTGSIIVPKSVTQPLEYYRNNVVGSTRLLRTCWDSGIGIFVFSSFSAVCDGDHSKVQLLTDDGSLAPDSLCGRSKLMTKMILRDIVTATDMRIVVSVILMSPAPIRRDGLPRWPLPDQAGLSDRLGCTALPHTEVFSHDYPTPGGACLHDYIYVSGLAEAHMAVPAKSWRQGETAQ